MDSRGAHCDDGSRVHVGVGLLCRLIVGYSRGPEWR